MAITYTDVNDATKLIAADLMLKVEAVDGALADIQTERATAELGYKSKEQDLQAEKNRLTGEMRKLQTATVKVMK